MIRSRKPFRFWWAPTISLEQLIVSGAVDLGQCGKLMTVIGHQFITITLTVERRHLCTERWARGTASRGSVSGSGDLLDCPVVPFVRPVRYCHNDIS